MKKVFVSTAVADLHQAPQKIDVQDYSHQDLRDSQLLFGEQLVVERQVGNWIKVAALEQPKFNKTVGWQPYSGWVKRHEVRPITHQIQINAVVHQSRCTLFDQPNGQHLFSLSCGTFVAITNVMMDWSEIQTADGNHYFCHSHDLELLQKIESNQLRQKIVSTAQLFIGHPYLWGGRAVFQNKSIASVDCSGIVNLCYRRCGLIIPRDAHDQFLICSKIAKEQLQPADLMFFSPIDKQRITHVVLYVGNHQFIEAPQTNEHVRLISEDELLKVRSTKYQLYFGSILHKFAKK